MNITDLKRAWRDMKRERPSGVAPAAAGQESVWDFPRPPKAERVTKRLRVSCAGRIIAETTRGLRVMETGSPPAYYFPPDDVKAKYLVPHLDKRTICEWKGIATYFNVHCPEHMVDNAAWTYAHPEPEYGLLEGYVAFYPQELECFIDDERVIPQPGSYYGGWITKELVGPFKGAPGTENW